MKLKMLAAITDARLKEADLEALCTGEPPDPSGRWRAQDHLSHLAWLRERESRVIAAVCAGAELPPDVEIPPDLSDGDQSTRIFEATRDQSAATVIAHARRSWDLLVAAIETCSDEDLGQPHPQQEGRKLVDDSPGNHLGAHLMWWYLEVGDVAAAEAIQLWARDVSGRLFDDQRSRGVAAYNLACFYARVGRNDQALPLLREGFEGSPSLKEWALKDPDLDPMRQDAAFLDLLQPLAAG